jgi:hypothetical protein
MVSGQAPNPKTSADCPLFEDFAPPTSLDASGQETGQGCVYPAGVPTLMSQLDAKGLTWRGYMDGMGADPIRESSTCGHPVVGTADTTEVATPLDQYATRHDPFVYFHGVIDNQASCDAHVVNLSQLTVDLASVAATPNYTFITPNLCNDGHDAPCANGGPGGLAQADAFLQTWVPRITSSPAFKQDGLLIVAFDEGVGDASACCGEAPGPYDQAHGIQPGGSGPGGGVVGAVLLSPFIAHGVRSTVSYNHYSMLASVEDLFGLARLAGANGTTAFGDDIYAAQPGGGGGGGGSQPPAAAPRITGLRLTPLSFVPRAQHAKSGGGTTIGYSDSAAATTTFAIVRQVAGYRRGHGACKAPAAGRRRPHGTKPCTARKPAGSLTRTDTAGPNRLRFTGLVRRRALPVGRYLLEATPRLGALAGKTASARFRVRAARKPGSKG